MKPTELVVLFPCHGLEDFPQYYEASLAEGLLAGWSALWHPALIAAAGSPPVWERADYGPAVLAGRLVVVPEACEDRLASDFAERAQAAGAVLLRHISSRREVVSAALSAADLNSADLDPELAADFLALGFCWLQVELLTRQMRYASQVDDVRFRAAALEAARAAVAGDGETARARLSDCFDGLNESRKYFYPVDSYLVDLTLLAETTLDEPLCRELECGAAVNVLTDAGLVEYLAERQPRSRSTLADALARGTASLVGGELHEALNPLRPPEAVLRDLLAALAAYQRLLDCRPYVYGRRTFGLSPQLPQVLARLGYRAALHFTLDDGHFPLGDQVKGQWEGSDGTTLDALLRVPRDAGKHETFLELARKLGESMDSDHVATLILAHWPGRAAEWYDDLRRIARYSTVLGKFVTLDDYFSQTGSSGRTNRFLADDYRTPYLKQAVARGESDPISRIVAEQETAVENTVSAGLATMTKLIGGSAADRDPAALGRTLVDALPKAAAGPPAAVVVNPLSFPRRVACETAGPSIAMAELPGMAFGPLSPPVPLEQLPDAEPVLSNQWLKVVVNPTTGGIQALCDLAHRGVNRLSQQLAYRFAPGERAAGSVWRDADEEAAYSVMAAESTTCYRSAGALQRVVCRGALLDTDGRRLAGFVQTVELWAARPLVTLHVEIDPLEPLSGDPWSSYYAARFAWPDPAANLFRGVGLERHPTDAKRLEATEYVEIDLPDGKTTILTGGLPYHRRTSLRTLDSLLVVPGESRRRFTLAIGVGLPRPTRAAMSLLARPVVVEDVSPPPHPEQGWLFHIDAGSVVATHWEPLPGGFRVRLKETAGRSGRVTLRSFRPLAAARTTDFLGQMLAELAVDGDKLPLDMRNYEWLQVEARFENP